MHHSHAAALDATITMLAELAVSGGARRGDTIEVYRLAREIRADAAIFGLKDITRAAHSLCELMASNRPAQQLWQGIAVHVQAIIALRQPAGDAAGTRTPMLEGLERISRSPPR